MKLIPGISDPCGELDLFPRFDLLVIPGGRSTRLRYHKLRYTRLVIRNVPQNAVLTHHVGQSREIILVSLLLTGEIRLFSEVDRKIVA